VTLSDARPEHELIPARESLADLPVRWAAGGHSLELLNDCDLLCLSGGVPLNLPIVAEAVRRGTPLSNDTQIFMEVAPCKTIGITGSAGKSTTTALVGEMARRACADHGPWTLDAISYGPSSVVYVGGNLGDPLINYADDMKPDDLAVLEISSFQLEQITASPDVAAVLNVTPNHLDRHGNMQAYTAAKARILDFQARDDAAILGRDDPGAWGLRAKVKGSLSAFSLMPLEKDLTGAYLDKQDLKLRDHSGEQPLMSRDQVRLRGDHNLSNVLAAFAIGQAAGLAVAGMLKAAQDFRGVPNRLELIRELHGVRWYNDSIATAPERSMADIRAFDEPLVLLLGGRDKDLPWADLAALVRERVDHVVLFGEAAEKIAAAIGEPQPGARPYSIARAESLKDAVCKAADVAQSGDVVLLAPGGTSYDAFKDFEERGEQFRQWVQDLS
jgi:UDP-N-acetylmuramoylalanine--D-glutamate ligase